VSCPEGAAGAIDEATGGSVGFGLLRWEVRARRDARCAAPHATLVIALQLVPACMCSSRRRTCDMPPLPATTQSLTTRLTALSEANKGVGHLVQRLAKLDFQPGSQPHSTDEGDVRLELSAEIHESLKGIEEDLELLRQEVEDVVGGANGGIRRKDSKSESERSRLAVLLARLAEDLKA
jgi:hypothetical protein